MQLVILLAILTVGGFTVGSNLLSGSTLPEEGDSAPDFVLSRLDGAQHHLSDYRGKYVLLNFWGSFCEPCVREMPEIQKQYEKYGAGQLQVIGVNLDEGVVTVKNFVSGLHLTFPILLDHNTIRKKYGVNSYPTTFFLDPQGKIIVKHIGEMDEAYLRQTLSGFLKDVSS